MFFLHPSSPLLSSFQCNSKHPRCTTCTTTWNPLLPGRQVSPGSQSQPLTLHGHTEHLKHVTPFLNAASLDDLPASKSRPMHLPLFLPPFSSLLLAIPLCCHPITHPHMQPLGYPYVPPRPRMIPPSYPPMPPYYPGLAGTPYHPLPLIQSLPGYNRHLHDPMFLHPQ